MASPNIIIIQFFNIEKASSNQLQGYLNIPIGLINSSWSGADAEVYLPSEIIINDPFCKKSKNKLCTADIGLII
jgi:hypothetical protein